MLFYSNFVSTCFNFWQSAQIMSQELDSWVEFWHLPSLSQWKWTGSSHCIKQALSPITCAQCDWDRLIVGGGEILLDQWYVYNEVILCFSVYLFSRDLSVCQKRLSCSLCGVTLTTLSSDTPLGWPASSHPSMDLSGVLTKHCRSLSINTSAWQHRVLRRVEDCRGVR